MCYGQWYERLLQILGELKYILQGVQKIRTSAGIKQGPLLLQGQKMMYLNFDRLKVW